MVRNEYHENKMVLLIVWKLRTTRNRFAGK